MKVILALTRSEVLRHVAMILSALLLTVVLALSASGSDKDKEPKCGATASLRIHATPAAVWDVLMNAKEFDSTVESDTVDGAVVEQRFTRLPIFGQMAVTFKVTMVPKERLNFRMLHSNCLKGFSGNWLVVPIGDNETKVEMRCFVDLGLPIPQFMVNQFMSGKMRKRLLKIRNLSEAADKSTKSEP